MYARVACACVEILCVGGTFVFICGRMHTPEELLIPSPSSRDSSACHRVERSSS
jgi:hypothetical protein